MSVEKAYPMHYNENMKKLRYVWGGKEAQAMKKGLILEGGAMRGMFTAGVMDVLMENGVDFDGVIGVSAGAAFG